MPEGPEVWILSKAVNMYYNTNKTKSYGKHLFIDDINENWSFGLTGKVKIDNNNELVKLNSGYVHGHQTKYNDYNKEIYNLGIDWLTCKEEEIIEEIKQWSKSRKMLAVLLLDQSKISGIGVAWGSEILYNSQLKPNIPACNQDINILSVVMIKMRDEIKTAYSSMVNVQNSKEFINGWYNNLYDKREMQIYKKGTQIKVSGRIWWF